MSYNYNDCPIADTSLYVRLRQYKDAGILKEVPTYHSGMGSGTCLTHNDVKIAVKTKVRGSPPYKHNLGKEFWFDEAHDVAYNPETNEMICFAKTNIGWN